MSRVAAMLHSPAAAAARRLVSRHGRLVTALSVAVALAVVVLAVAGPGTTTKHAPPAAQQAGARPVAARHPVAAASTVAPPAAPAAPSPCARNTIPQLFLVSVSQQHGWACAGDRQVFSTPVTTGDVAAGWSTPTGTWRIEDKQTDRYLVGAGYRDYVHYWMPFFGNYGLHDATWQTFPFGSTLYRTQGSHGCVHLPEAAMTQIYDWATVGTTVTIAA